MRKLFVGVIAIAAGAALGAGIVSCGDQTSSTTETTAPELTAPIEAETETQPVQPTTSTSNTTTSTTETTNGADREKTTSPEKTPDTETTDKPPPSNSAAEKFERYCEENPGACD